MLAVKENKQYTITADNAESFRSEGYDIIDDNGAIIAYGKGKVVAYDKYVTLLKRYEALERENAELRKTTKKKDK